MLIAQPLPPPEAPQVIVVTGEALPEPVAERPYAAIVLTRDRLANAPSHQLDSILAAIPGLQLFRRSDSTSGHPTSQGVTLRALGGNASSRALLILDGVPQSDPFGGWVNWPAYDPASLSDVRIVRGGGSVAYGPGALAGTIEMQSLAMAGLESGIEAGSRNSLLARARAGSEGRGGLFTVNVRGSRSDGFVPVTRAGRGPADRAAPYREASLRARWIAGIADDVEMQASALGFAEERERGLAFSGNRTRGADLSMRLVGSGRWRWSATGYGQWRNFRSSFASVDDGRTTARRVALQDSVPSTGIGASIELRPPVGRDFELRIGGDHRSQDGESRELYAFADGEPTRRRQAGGDSATTGLFIEGAWSRGALVASAGARLDRWHIGGGRLTERLIATGVATRDDAFPDRSGWQPTARAGLEAALGGGLSLRSAAYTGWRLPTLNELFRPFRAGPDATAANAGLEPERLAGAEGGIGFERGGIDLSLTAFVNRLSDSIANVTLAQGPGLFPGVGFVAGAYRQRRNLDAVLVRGIEADASYRRGSWTVRAGASLNDAKVRADGPASNLDGLRPAQTPRFAMSGSVAWEKAGHSAELLVRHTGAQFEDDLNSLELPPATTVGAFAALPLAPRLQLVGRAENLFGATVVAGLDEDGVVERARPRTFWVGVRLRGL